MITPFMKYVVEQLQKTVSLSTEDEITEILYRKWQMNSEKMYERPLKGEPALHHLFEKSFYSTDFPCAMFYEVDHKDNVYRHFSDDQHQHIILVLNYKIKVEDEPEAIPCVVTKEFIIPWGYCVGYNKMKLEVKIGKEKLQLVVSPSNPRFWKSLQKMDEQKTRKSGTTNYEQLLEKDMSAMASSILEEVGKDAEEEKFKDVFKRKRPNYTDGMIERAFKMVKKN